MTGHLRGTSLGTTWVSTTPLGRWLLVAVAIASLLVAACGDDGETPADTTLAGGAAQDGAGTDGAATAEDRDAEDADPTPPPPPDGDEDGDGDEGSAAVDPPRAEEVRLLTEDGLRLAGRLVTADRDRLVVLMHMYPADQEAWRPMQDRLAERGYSALTFNFRGYPGSDGERDGSDVETDARSALQFASERGFAEVVLAGASMGGTAAIAVGATAPPGLVGVIALSAPEVFRGVDAGAVVAAVPVPLLVIAGDGDPSARAAVDRFTERASIPAGRSLVLPTAAHGTDLLESSAADEVTAAIDQFLDTVWP